jgi:hypothetical protein
MEWIAFVFALELGAIRGSDIPVDVSSYVQMEAAAVVLGHLEIGGSLRSYQVPDGDQAWPFRMDYTVDATVRFGGISLGVEHTCHHPVVPYRIHKVAPSDGFEERVFIRASISDPR